MAIHVVGYAVWVVWLPGFLVYRLGWDGMAWHVTRPIQCADTSEW